MEAHLGPVDKTIKQNEDLKYGRGGLGQVTFYDDSPQQSRCKKLMKGGKKSQKDHNTFAFNLSNCSKSGHTKR